MEPTSRLKRRYATQAGLKAAARSAFAFCSAFEAAMCSSIAWIVAAAV